MKKISKIAIWILVIFFCLFVAGNISITLFGKKILINQIEHKLKVEASLEGISLGFPFSVNLTGLKLGNFFAADRISLAPNILSVFTGRIIFDRVTLINPVFNLRRSTQARLNLPKLQPGQKGKDMRVFLIGLVIENGKVIFTDRKITPEGYKIVFKAIDARIFKVMFPPTSLKINFKIVAELADASEKKLGNANLSGWVDLGPKDMDAVLNINDLDATYFYPYYGNFISNEQLLSARVNVSSTLKAKHNDLLIQTNFRLSDLVYAQARDTRQEELDILDFAKNTLDLFTDEQGNLILDFSINTKLDNPGINIDKLKDVILEAAVKNLSRQSPATIIEKINKNIEQFKEFGKQMESIFKGK